MWNLANSTGLGGGGAVAGGGGKSDDNSLAAMMSRSSFGEEAVNGRRAESPQHQEPRSPTSRKADLPPLFWYMESGDWEKAHDRIRRHPREIKTWATLRTKSSLEGPTAQGTSTTKRLALHHACFKLRAAGALSPSKDDPFVEVCRLILFLVKLYPEAAQKRESRHGCLPLHLAAFASSAPRESEDASESSTGNDRCSSTMTTEQITRPNAVSKRSNSDATTDTMQTNLSAVHAEETYTGAMSDTKLKKKPRDDPGVSVSMRANTGFSAKREEMLVQVINALLDAYVKAARVDSEGGRLPLHTACAGRATPRVISTLITAYPAAARQRNKDGFLPLHLAAHWGVSDIAVAVQLLKTYPDATVGRNRWERTPLEEALCMAGENGRPHQAALVRALRKHPSWWTRPYAEIMAGARRPPNSPPTHRSTAVDVDESLPSNDDSTYGDRGKMQQHSSHFANQPDEL